MQQFVIKGRLDGLNEYTRANRTNQYKGAKLKKDNETICMYYINHARIKPVKNYPIKIEISWYEKDKRRDIDNVTFATKFILDSLVKLKIITDDSQKHVTEINHHVNADKENPRIEIKLIEGEAE